MPRPHRNFVPSLYHIGSHGSDVRRLFVDDDDRVDFLARLSRGFRQLDIDIASYALLTNHYHALVYTPDDRLSRALQGLHGGYSLRHNRRHARRAHLFRAHCFAVRIESEAHLLWVCRYIARNPVEAGLVQDPLEWPWSSARIHAGLVDPPSWLTESYLCDAYGGDTKWRERYRDYVTTDKDPPERASRVAGAGFGQTSTTGYRLVELRQL